LSRILASIKEILALERNPLVLCTTVILLNVAMNLYGPFLSLYLISLETPMELLGVIFAIFGFVNALFVLAAGHFSDRYGRKNIIVLSHVISAISLLPLYWVGLWPIAVACLLGMNFGRIFYSPAATAIVADSLPQEKRATGFGTMATIAYWGAVFAPIIGGYLSLGENYRVVFLFASSLIFIMAILRQLLLKETRVKRERNIDEDQSSEHLSFIEKLRLIWTSSRSTRAYLVFGIMSSLSGALAGPWFSIFYQEVISLDTLQIGIISSAFTVSNIIAQIPGGKLSDKIGRKLTILQSLVAGPLLILGMTQATSFTQLLIIQIISGSSSGLASGASFALPTELVPAEYRGTALGVFSFTEGIAGALGSSLGSLIVAYYSFTAHPRGVFYASILSSIPSIIIFLAFIKETLKRVQ
jgi:MFS family permease